MPGMNSGPDRPDPAVVAAFRAALLHQGLIALLMLAVLAGAWAVMRARSRARAPAAHQAGRRRAFAGALVTGTEPAGRRLLRIGFGLLWLFDGILQAQPAMPTGLPSQVVQPTAGASEPWVQHLVRLGENVWIHHPVPAASAAVWIQIGLGVWLLAAPYGALSRLAGLASAGWGLLVWVFGESFGGIFAPGLTWLTGAPGSAGVYVAAGVMIALPWRAWASPRLGQLTLAGLGLFLAVMAGLQAQPSLGYWQGTRYGQPGPLATMIQSMAQTPQPRLLSGWVTAFGAFDQAHGFAVNLVAVATERLRVGTFVLNACLRHPVVLAQDLATLDALSGGRLEIGLGAGWNKPEHDAIGIPFDPTGVRIKRLAEAIAILKGCFAEGPFSFSGEHYTITGHDGTPKPAQRPHPPIFVGGGGKRLLTLAAREAQIIGLAPRLVPGDPPRVDARSLTAAATEAKIRWIHEAAGNRFGELELNTYPSGGPTVITGNPRAEARRRADCIREQTGVELTIEEILDSPHVLIGSIKDLMRKFADLRERFGISSFMIDDLDALAPLVQELAGQ